MGRGLMHQRKNHDVRERRLKGKERKEVTPMYALKEMHDKEGGELYPNFSVKKGEEGGI